MRLLSVFTVAEKCQFMKQSCKNYSSVAASNLAFVPSSPPLDSIELEEFQEFVFRSKKLFVLTGAGVSTESGIPDYRSEGVGLYARTARRPIQHSEFVRSAMGRQSYWARNYVGWLQFCSCQPNVAHNVLSKWENLGKLHWLVTQNVDALHTKAGSQRLTELHGCTYRVICLGCGDITPRAHLQEKFVALNPGWTEEAHGIAPDGDVFLTDEQVKNFNVPSCESCGGTLKPDVTFFGDTVHKEKVNFVYERMAESDAVLVAGSSLQVKQHCLELGAASADYVLSDMNDLSSAENVVKETQEKLGGLDYLVLNHIGGTEKFGYFKGKMQNVVTDLTVNFLSYVQLSSAAMSMLKESEGSIIVMSSLSGRIGAPFTAVYSASKFAVEGFYSSLRRELNLQQVNVSITVAILGLIDTDNAIKIVGNKVKVAAAPKEECALEVVKAGVLRIPEVFYPFWGIKFTNLLRDIAPGLIAKLLDQAYILENIS